MTNREIVKQALKAQGFELGLFDKHIEKLSRKDLSKVIANMEYGSCDIPMSNGNVVEVFHVDNEVDFFLTSKAEYSRKYGREYSA